jgi:uncharacterized membrane protein
MTPRFGTPGAQTAALVLPAASPLQALFLGMAGGALLAGRRSLPSRARAAAALGGIALIGVAARRPVVDAIRRAGTRRRAADVSLSFVVDHPVERVFAFCRDFENYPRFIGALREVRDHGDGRSHWCASTPSGGTIEWDTVTTKYVPNSVIAWQSVGHAPIEVSAVVRFRPEGGTTCIKVVASYRVLDGGMADAIAALAAPSREADLQRDIRRLAVYLDTALAPDETADG